LRTGGLSGINKLINSKALGTIELSTGLQISGVFSNVIEFDGKPVYVQTTGKTALANREKELVNEELLTDPMCLNLKPGGQGGLVSESHGIKLKLGSSSFQKEKWKNREYRDKLTKVLRNNAVRNHKDGKMRYDTTKGKKISDEHKKKISKKNSIKQKGKKNSQFGSRWITNGVENKKLKKTEKLPFGWRFGRICV
jgi:hypothetical protein